MKMEKKGEVSTTMLISVILLILGLGILLFVYFQLGWTGIVDREVCHQSVIYRATLPGVADAKEYIPLKCKTEKICITSNGFLGFGKGECEEYKNEEGILTIGVSSVGEIEKVVARDILDCWNTMGEGKVSIFNQWFAEQGFGEVYSSCVICSRIAFDKEGLEKSNIDLDKVNVIGYMRTHKVPNGDLTYYEYLAKEDGKISVDPLTLVNELSDEELVGSGLEEKNVKSGELGIMFMQITGPTLVDSLAGIGLGVIAGAKVGSVGGGIGIVGGAVVGGILPGWFAIENRDVTAAKCSDVSVGDESRKGCSVVRTVNYNASSIANYCSVIESIA
jgi:hypothetical protein